MSGPRSFKIHKGFPSTINLPGLDISVYTVIQRLWSSSCEAEATLTYPHHLLNKTRRWCSDLNQSHMSSRFLEDQQTCHQENKTPKHSIIHFVLISWTFTVWLSVFSHSSSSIFPSFVFWIQLSQTQTKLGIATQGYVYHIPRMCLRLALCNKQHWIIYMSVERDKNMAHANA